MLRIPKPLLNMREDSRTEIGRFSGLDQNRNGAEQTRTSRMENVVEDTMINFGESGHPEFRGSTLLERGAFRSKVK